MYGTWFTVTLGGIGVLLLIIAIAATLATPIFAIAIVLVVLALIAFLMSGRRRSSEPASPEQARGQSEATIARGTDAQTAATQPSRSGGAPASGEGA